MPGRMAAGAGFGRAQTQGWFPVEVTLIRFFGRPHPTTPFSPAAIVRPGWPRVTERSPKFASSQVRKFASSERSMRHLLFGLLLGCSIGLVTQSSRAADEGGGADRGGGQGPPLAPLPSQEPAFYEPLPPPLAPRRRFQWGAEF